MKQLWLKFTDENGAPKRVLVEGEKFSVGRHSECDLSIANSALSRKHLQIERFGDVFVISDLGSSNGTKVNAEDLTDPVGIKNGDRLDVGGGLEIEVELIDEDNDGKDSKDDAAAGGAENAASAEPNVPGASAAAGSGGSSFTSSIFFIAPLFGVFILMLVGGLFFAFSGKPEKEIVKRNDDFIYSEKDKDSTDFPKNDQPEKIEESPTPDDLPANSTVETSDTKTVSTPDENVAAPVPEISDELEKIEKSSASFMRKMALNDPRAFLTGKQQEILKAKINQFRNSSALADNLKSAKRNAPQIEALAKSKSLNPQFLATAALARLGNSRGDVPATAQTMADVLADLSRNIGNELANENLLILAAYEQGAAGKTLEMRNMLQNLVGKFPESSRQIRTIWFLKENDKISESQYEFALRFLAIGTISQSPKDYGVQAEALSF